MDTKTKLRDLHAHDFILYVCAKRTLRSNGDVLGPAGVVRNDVNNELRTGVVVSFRDVVLGICNSA